MIAAPDRDPFAFSVQRRLSHCNIAHGANTTKKHYCKCDNCKLLHGAWCALQPTRSLAPPARSSVLATEQELSDFLKSVEKRAFKRSIYHVRNEEAALDIVQDSMMKLAEHYGDKPANELPMLFQRILSNCTLDWFRRQKRHNALFTDLGSFESTADDAEGFDLLQVWSDSDPERREHSAEDMAQRGQTMLGIEQEIEALPARQREAFLMRYWEEMDVAETAAAMGCSEGSVKTHCFRAIQALSKALRAKGIKPS